MARKSTPQMPEDMFNDQNSAIAKLTGASGRTRTSTQETPVAPPPDAPAEPAKKEVQSRSLKQTSFYLSPEQLLKLDDLAHNHYRRTGKRINRNDIVRHLVDRCELSDLTDLDAQKYG